MLFIKKSITENVIPCTMKTKCTPELTHVTKEYCIIVRILQSSCLTALVTTTVLLVHNVMQLYFLKHLVTMQHPSDMKLDIHLYYYSNTQTDCHSYILRMHSLKVCHNCQMLREGWTMNLAVNVKKC